MDVDSNEKLAAAVAYLKEIFTLMGASDVEMHVEKQGEAHIVKVEGEDVGVLIGQMAVGGVFPGQVADGVDDEADVLMGDPAGEEQGSGLILVPFQHAVAADPLVVAVDVPHPVAQIVEGALFPQHP